MFGTLNETVLDQSLQYVLDGKPTSFNGTGTPSRILYTSPLLPEGDHTLTLALMTNTSVLVVDGMNVTRRSLADDHSSNSAAQKNHISEIVGGTIGGLLLIILLSVMFFLHRRRRHRTAGQCICFTTKNDPLIYVCHLISGPYAMGPMQACLPTSKEAFTSRNYSNYGLSFRPSLSNDSFARSPQKASTRDSYTASVITTETK